MKKNKGFSLVELIIVVAIMAVLMGILIPTLVKQTSRSKRSVDVDTASEIVGAIQRTLSGDTELYYKYSGDSPANYTFTWNANSKADDFRTDEFAYAVISEFGSIPTSKWKKTFEWKVTYNGTTEKIHIYLLDSASDQKGYEVYPEHDTYVKKYKKKDVEI